MADVPALPSTSSNGCNIVAIQENQGAITNPPTANNQDVPVEIVLEREAQQGTHAVNQTFFEMEKNGVKISGKAEMQEKVQEKLTQKDEMRVQPDGRVVVKRTIISERIVAQQALVEIYIDAIDHPFLALEDGSDPEVIPTKFEEGIDFCCQSCTCNFQNPFKRQRPITMKRKEFMTPILRRGRAKGWNMFSHFAFPLVRDTLRIIWTISELLIAIFGLIFSIVSYATGNIEAFNTFHLVLSIVSALLAILDGAYSVKERFKEKCVQEGHNMEEGTEQIGKCYQCWNSCKTYCDIARVVITELLLVPLLICDIFEVVTGAPEIAGNAGNIIGIILFIIGCISIVLYVYLIRLSILIGIVKYVQVGRSPTTDNQAELDEIKYDPSLRKFGLIFQIVFLVHVAGQMMGQILMFVAIGGKIRYDNRHLYEPRNSATHIYVSPELWYMCIAATILPIFGLFTFFIVTNFWTQEFPISLCLDMIKVLQMPGVDEVFDFKNDVKKKAKEMSRVISEFVRVNKLEPDYNDMRKTAFLDKLAYPFKSPALVIICLLYAVSQLGFVLCAAMATSETGRVATQFLNGGGWIIYYIVAVILGALANFYVFAIAAVWLIIIAAVISIILIIVGLFCLAAACAMSGDSSSDNRR